MSDAATTTESNGSATDGTVVAAPPSAYARRKQREADEAKKAADRKTKREARAATKAAEPAQAEPAEVVQLDEVRAVQVLGVFVRLLFRVAKGVAYLFGGQLAALTDPEVFQQAKLLVPYAVAFPGFYRLASWVAWPALFLDLVVSKFSRRGTEASP